MISSIQAGLLDAGMIGENRMQASAWLCWIGQWQHLKE